MRTGTARLPLHRGRAPAWLFGRMRRLGAAVVTAIVEDRGPEEVLRRVADPFWFQALGCLLGFDWHSSGLTTVVCGALKEGLRGREGDLGIVVAGGKGAASRRTPAEIAAAAERFGLDGEALVRASRLSAKVDSAAVQDGYQVYHHAFFFTASGAWSVVQQGMNEQSGYARRYHWLGEAVGDFACEPHAAVCCDERGRALNMVAAESDQAREGSLALVREGPAFWEREFRRLGELELPPRHRVLPRDLASERLWTVLVRTYEAAPASYADLLGVPGVGPRTVRSLALVAELVYGARPSFRDPARFAFAHGGKDGHPYPVDRATYDAALDVLEGWLERARLEASERRGARGRLAALWRAVGGGARPGGGRLAAG